MRWRDRLALSLLFFSVLLLVVFYDRSRHIARGLERAGGVTESTWMPRYFFCGLRASIHKAEVRGIHQILSGPIAESGSIIDLTNNGKDSVLGRNHFTIFGEGFWKPKVDRIVPRTWRDIGFCSPIHTICLRFGRELFSAIPLIHATHHFGSKTRGRNVPRILNYESQGQSVRRIGFDSNNTYIGPIADFESLGTDLIGCNHSTPLKYCCNSIGNAKQYSRPFQTILFKENSFYLSPNSSFDSPTWKTWICAVLGIMGICWGWRESKHLPWSRIVFVVGGLLWGYALFVILPWSIG